MYVYRQLLDEMISTIEENEQQYVLQNTTFTPQILFCVEQLRQLTNFCTQVQTQLNMVDMTDVQLSRTKPLLQQLQRSRPYITTAKQSIFIPENVLNEEVSVTHLINYDPTEPVKYTAVSRFENTQRFMKIIIKNPGNFKEEKIEAPFQSWNNILKSEIKIETLISPYTILKLFQPRRDELIKNLIKMKPAVMLMKQIRELSIKEGWAWLTDAVDEVMQTQVAFV
ncbi:Hypothetical_protein [Hexamita inflata]|uniref:Hypothetical_protein n=1 Tax=Hexamita inflata TaxID=28002 RepID=A0AA86Q2G7_9EUKA|nr:Hypothetical protein HINF_LOCUS31734 [Hexamita inflata]